MDDEAELHSYKVTWGRDIIASAKHRLMEQTVNRGNTRPRPEQGYWSMNLRVLCVG
jgi:hypothetical protein